MKRTYMLAVVTFVVLALGGCNRSPAHASQETLESNPAALEAAMKACSADPQNGSAPSSNDCQHVEYAAYVVRSQYLAGVVGYDTAAMAIETYYGKTGKLPASNEQAGLPAPNAIAGDQGAAKDVDSVIVGSPPGAITVKWSGGALTGKALVLKPVVPGSSNPRLCWNVDPKATTVPEMIQKLSPTMVSGCN